MAGTIFPPRTTSTDIEEGLVFRPAFDENGLIPCITVDAETGEVLMFAHMNEESLKLTLDSGKASYYSRSRRRIWVKGERSGFTQEVVALQVDCDQDVILLKVNVAGAGGCCHNGYRSCFYRKVDDPKTFRLVQTQKTKVFDPSKAYGEGT